MNNFSYTRATDVAGAVKELSIDKAAKFIAGGTNILDLSKALMNIKFIERGQNNGNEQTWKRAKSFFYSKPPSFGKCPCVSS